ncbi:MAG: D-alanyl-D-alanine carboxypeptidase/D-alanyl-D-alanine-endopeptidase [Melioribacteraceae bacterium]|nr:D-alanyl-D-alanine carboxypeptidase/D-alanyl-D-alanine-endopeptidase [Melioribacteraceae bacterium]
MPYKIVLLLCIFPFILSAQKDSLISKQPIPITSLAELRDQLDDYFNEPSFNDAFWGVLIKSLKTGEVIYKRNSDKLFSPASDLKLFTTASALQILGPDFAYETNIYRVGDVVKGTLKGDLIIVGSGDPTISNRFNNKSATIVFEEWADTLKKKGIWEITGNIYGDDSYFDKIGIGRGWSSDLESKWYAAPTGALSFNDNSIEIQITPAQEGRTANVVTVPKTSFVNVVHNVITIEENSEPQIEISFLKETNTIKITGTISRSTALFKDRVAIADPTLYFLTVLKETFEHKGIKIRGTVDNLENTNLSYSIDEYTPTHTHISVPLRLILKETNKNSNNFYAEQLLKTIGAEEYDFGTTYNGVKACKNVLSELGINTEKLIMVDGSGLSELNLVTPRQIVNLLTYMTNTENYSKFYESLPVGGVDGTLIERMKKSSAENNVRAKPGFSNYVSALSGYLRTVSGESIVFSMIINNYLGIPRLATYTIDNVCHRLINFARN